MQNSQANTKKIFTKFFWRAGKVTDIVKSRRSLGLGERADYYLRRKAHPKKSTQDKKVHLNKFF